jgi:hypothetical protein
MIPVVITAAAGGSAPAPGPSSSTPACTKQCPAL